MKFHDGPSIASAILIHTCEAYQRAQGSASPADCTVYGIIRH
jgi:hypothetical protein